MPSAPAQDVIDAATPFLVDVGIPGELAQAFWQGLDDAGLTVVAKDTGDPAEAVDTVAMTRERVEGAVGMFILKIAVEDGFLVCVEQAGKVSGQQERSAWVYVPAGA